MNYTVKIQKSIKFILTFLLLLVLDFNFSYSQAGVTFYEFSEKIDKYFDRELILDMEKEMPQTEYAIWGWDVGDYSGDGVVDCAFAIKLRGERKNRLFVYFFVDIDGYLQLVHQEDYPFFELPLEVGVVIKNNNCLITQKNKLYDWHVKGYTFDNGNFFQTDLFSTEQVMKLTREKYINYQTLINTEKIINANGKTDKSIEYNIIPSYLRGKKVYPGLKSEIEVTNVDHVYKGAYYWQGEEDCSFKAKSAYDEEFLYFTVYVKDDNIIPYCEDKCAVDHVELFIDCNLTNSNPTRLDFNTTTNKFEIKSDIEPNLMQFSVFPGDFKEIKPFVEISAQNEISPKKRLSVQSIRSSSNLIDSGYVIKFKIPFTLIGYEGKLFEDDNYLMMRTAIVVHDIDNQYRTEEESCLASSDKFEFDPSTYGTLMLIPSKKWYGFSANIYTDEILQTLNDYGY